MNNTASAGPMTLRHAIDSANSNPGPDLINFDPAVFPPGNPAIIAVDIELSEVDDTEGITIDGTGAGVIIDGSNAGDSDGLVFDSPTDDSGTIVIKHLTVQNFGGDALLVFNDGDVESVTFEHIVATDNGGAGVDFLVDGSIGPTVVTDSEFSRNGDEGLYLGPDGEMTETTVRNVIANGNGAIGLQIYPTLAGSNVTVENSTFSENVDVGMEIDGTPLLDITIRDVTASMNGDDGISIYSSAAIDNVDVANVTATDNADAGISVSAGGAMSGLRVHDSRSTGNEYGMWLYAGGAGSKVVSGNTVTGNNGDAFTVLGGEAGPSAGIARQPTPNSG